MMEVDINICSDILTPMISIMVMNAQVMDLSEEMSSHRVGLDDSLVSCDMV